MGRRAAIASAAALAALGLAQVVPVSRDAPPARNGPGAPAEAAAVLRRACYDCHSNETRWPWYSHLAPVSWLVAHDVHEGREHLNFSDWPVDAPDTEDRLLRRSAREVGEHEMPPALYALMHPEARLSPADRRILMEWFTGHPVQGSPSVAPRPRSLGAADE